MELVKKEGIFYANDFFSLPSEYSFMSDSPGEFIYLRGETVITILQGVIALRC